MVNQSQVSMVVIFMMLSACSSTPSPHTDASAAEHQPPTMFHEQRLGSGLLGNTIQFWSLHHGLTEDHKNELSDQRVNQPINRPMNRQAEQQLGHLTIQKPDRQLDRPINQQQVRRLNRPGNRTMNRSLNRKN